MSELKPCPFCGGEAFYIKIMGNYEKPHEIYCSKCNGAITEGRSEKQVVTNWNTRPIEDALHARIAELEEENDRLQDAWFVEDEMRVSEHANYLLNEYGRLQFDYAAYCKPYGESLRNEARNNLETYIAELEAERDQFAQSATGLFIVKKITIESTQERRCRDVNKC